MIPWTSRFRLQLRPKRRIFENPPSNVAPVACRVSMSKAFGTFSGRNKVMLVDFFLIDGFRIIYIVIYIYIYYTYSILIISLKVSPKKLNSVTNVWFVSVHKFYWDRWQELKRCCPQGTIDWQFLCVKDFLRFNVNQCGIMYDVNAKCWVLVVNQEHSWLETSSKYQLQLIQPPIALVDCQMLSISPRYRPGAYSRHQDWAGWNIEGAELLARLLMK